MDDHKLNELTALVEKITNIPNSAILLKELVKAKAHDYHKANVTNLSIIRFRQVKKAGIKYCMGEVIINMNTYSKYQHLSRDPLAAMLYTIAYLELFASTIPSDKQARWKLINDYYDISMTERKYMNA